MEVWARVGEAIGMLEGGARGSNGALGGAGEERLGAGRDGGAGRSDGELGRIEVEPWGAEWG